jgi:cytochrome oxidase Cu insertion factor (SCO1/SenC/PrrC family)
MRAGFRFLSALFFASALGATVDADAQQRAKPVAVGEQAPNFTLTDQSGRSHSLAAERGKRPVVLVFYRGYW